ncbi:DUF3027 domain-containing protein [Zhihengliuella halotolerans]|uniref:DUF3027 family protein n=1 Tax=Zhihengliuella halotolerans TaxID=370736 RepID=A0A4Q8AAB8_9MICC|nr:DUF3027 domain-containing protein [Zhihengliuella halotolerans]RZU60601.1 DUF3027 family protein [Zhihengliuella halotolerans]
MARTPKLDDVLAADVASAREALARQIPDGQIGEHLGVSAEGDRLVLHRFAAKMRGYAGWHWYVTLARGPRVKVATVCDSGLLPGQDALLAPAWVPWAERVAPEELAEQKARDESEAAEAAAAAEPAASAGEEHDDATSVPEAPAEAAEEPEAAPADAETDAPDDGASEPEDDEEDGPTRPRRRRRPRRRQRSTS